MSPIVRDLSLAQRAADKREPSPGSLEVPTIARDCRLGQRTMSISHSREKTGLLSGFGGASATERRREDTGVEMEDADANKEEAISACE